MATFLQTLRRRLRRYLEQRRAETDTETLVGGTKFCSECQEISARLEKVIDRGFDGRDEWRKYNWRRYRDFVTYITDLKHPSVNQDLRKKSKDQYGISNDFSHISDSFCMWVGSVPPWDRELVLRLPYKPGPWSRVGLALEVRSDSGKIGGCLVEPYADFELVKSWFDDCTLHHGTTTCQTDASILQDIPGLRVIDCSSRRLVSWSQLPTNQDRNYVALSYVWGAKPDDGNEGDMNISDRTVDWPLPSQLPPLIEDTITAVTQLGFRYLWVDRYCIPQGDEEAKHTQIQNMHSIYGSASLTIVAATGNDPSHGLPGVAAFSVLEDSMWASRAWTMQEAFLSCRCLVFFDDGAYFQCSTPRSHRFEAIHEPPALLQPGHPAYSKKHYCRNPPADSMILTKIGKAGDLKLKWCLKLLKDYFHRNLTFENDTLNAFSGILKYMQSLKPPIHNLWGVLMLPDVLPTSPEQRIRYNLVLALAWFYREHTSRGDPISHNLGKLEGTTKSPRKEMFPSWTWADWRPRLELHGGGGDDDKYTINYHLHFHPRDTSFTSLVNLSVELDDGRIVSWAQGYLYDSDVSWLATLPNPPRILHIQGYTANPQLRYITEEEWAGFNERTILPIKGAHPPSENDGYPEEHWYDCDDKAHHIWIDADGQHLQPLLELRVNFREQPRCWNRYWWDVDSLYRRNLCAVAYHVQRQRGNQADAIEPYTECTFDFRVIVLGYTQSGYVYYMMLMKAPGTDNQTETFERVNVLEDYFCRHRFLENRKRMEVKEFLARLTGKHAEPFRGTPWVKMNTRIA
ncbi:HET-domain-containing protein [Neurospora crassa]|nr:HET-domain-containing protein [Neurospora crassa]